MAKKKRKSGGKGNAQRRNPLAEVLGTADAAEAQDRVTATINRMLVPPENVLGHLQRVKAPFWIAPFAIDELGEPYHRACVVIPFDDLVSAEIAALSPDEDAEKIAARQAAAVEEINTRVREAAANQAASMGVKLQQAKAEADANVAVLESIADDTDGKSDDEYDDFLRGMQG